MYIHNSIWKNADRRSGNFSGRIIKNKAFFFGSCEGTRQVQGDTFTGTVPTALQEEGNFSQTYNSAGALITIYNPFTTTQNTSSQYVRTAFPGNMIPLGPGGPINPTAQAFLDFYPAPNTPTSSPTDANNYTSAYPYRVRKDDFWVRVDHEISERQHAFAEVFYDRTPCVFPNVYNDPGSPTYAPQVFERRGGVLSDTFLLNSTTVLNFEYGFNRLGNVRYASAQGYNLSQLGFAPSFASEMSPAAIPVISIAGFNVVSTTVSNTADTGQAFGDTTLIVFGIDSHVWQGTLTKTAGRHTLKFGGEFNLLREDAQQNPGTNGFTFTSAFTQGPIATTASSTAGSALASFLLGTPANGSITSNPALALQSFYYAIYAQDDLKVTSKFTVNLGLRYEYEAPWTDRFNQLTNFNFQTVPPLTASGLNLHGALSFVGVYGNPRGQWNPSRDNFAPRLGFAYSLGQKTVIRGGAGLSYAPGITSDNWTSTTGFATTTTFVGSPNTLTPYNLLNDPFPSGLLKPVGSSRGAATDLGQSITFTDRNFKVPTSGAWNLQIQRELPSHIVASIAYVGERGWDEYQALQFNQLPDSDLAQGSALLKLVPNPFYGQITSGAFSATTVSQAQLDLPYPQFQSLATNYSSWASSAYNALQLTVEKRLSRGFSVNASYTWSRLMDKNTGDFSGQTLGAASYQDYYSLRNEWAVSALDVPRRLMVAYRWELPVGPRHQHFQGGPALKVLGGWQVEGITAVQTSETLGIGDATNTSDSTNAGGQRPNWSGVNPALAHPSINEWFNISVFSRPAAFTFDNAPRSFGTLHASPLRNFDFSAIKNTQLTEKFSLQLRAEFFNLFNTPQFNPPPLPMAREHSEPFQDSKITPASFSWRQSGSFEGGNNL